jgi:hypothetical protein
VSAAPNYNSTDSRHYPSPKMHLIEQQSPNPTPGYSGAHAGVLATPPSQPVTQSTPQNYASPRNESHPNYSQSSSSGSQSQGSSSSQSSSSQSQGQSHGSGRDKNQNGH